MSLSFSCCCRRSVSPFSSSSSSSSLALLLPPHVHHPHPQISKRKRRFTTTAAPAPYQTILSKQLHAIDVHTHMYLPGYMKLLRSRTEVPRVVAALKEEEAERLIILPGEDQDASTAAGRPIGDEYWSVESKLRFMERHGIATSVVSLANPWLDFLNKHEALGQATDLNEELQRMSEDAAGEKGRIYGFGTLPLQAAEGSKGLVAELERLREMSSMRGIVLAAQGLDHPRMEAVYEACERLGLVIFLHPHYGIGGGDGDHRGEQGEATTRDYGHVLPLALGFPFETSLAVARLLLSGYLDRFPRLTFLLAHAGGTLPFLAGRLDSCVAHDLAVATRLQHTPSEYLRRNFYFDGVIYHRPGLEALLQFLGPDYSDRVVWGTDHPFFPPPPPARKEVDLWPSTMKNYQILLEGEGEKGEKEWEAIVRGNASKLLDIPSFA